MDWEKYRTSKKVYASEILYDVEMEKRLHLHSKLEEEHNKKRLSDREYYRLSEKVNIGAFQDEELKEKVGECIFPKNLETASTLYDILLNHPLIALTYAGYRYYKNTKNWACYFCEREIKEHEGYWAHKQMKWSQGPKMCHECFLKFLSMIEYNSELFSLIRSFKYIDGRWQLQSRMEEVDFVNTINSLAKYYDEFKSLKIEESSDEFIRRIITIVKNYQKWVIEQEEKLRDLKKKVKEIEMRMKELEEK